MLQRPNVCVLCAVNALAGLAILPYITEVRSDRAKIMFENWGGSIRNDREEIESDPELKALIKHPERILPGNGVRIGDEWCGIDADLHLLHEIGNVRSVSLYSPRIADESLRMLIGLPDLQEIWISPDTSISPRGLALLGQMKTLREVSLMTPQISDRTCAALGGLPAMQRLYLGSAENVSVFGLLSLLRSNSLRDVVLGGVQPEVLKALADSRLSHNTSVRRIRWFASGLDAPHIVQLCRHLDKLELLHLGYSDLPPNAVEQIRIALPGVTVQHSRIDGERDLSQWNCFGPRDLFGK